MNVGLRNWASAYNVRALDDAPVAALPLADLSSWEDEGEEAARIQRLTYEEGGQWAPIPCEGLPAVPPRRFIDGSVFSRTVAAVSVDGHLRPVVLACIGALSLHLDGRRLIRPAQSVRVETVLCLLTNGVPRDDASRLADGLMKLGIGLVTSETTEAAADFDTLRRRTWDLAKRRMEDAEREVLFDEPSVPAVVDGLLERRLTTAASQTIAAVGVVKRQVRHYLPETHLPLMYQLRSGERTPAFLLETEHASIVSWYFRMSDSGIAAPGYGVVRMSVPKQYLETNFPDPKVRTAEISALSAYLRRLRHREQTYARAAVSLEPIVRVEDELRALLPDIKAQVARLHRAFGL